MTHKTLFPLPAPILSDKQQTVRHRYKLIPAKGHPAAPKGARVVREHRVVLYDLIGPGTHPCHWCGKPVTWGETLVVDHLNDIRTDNAPANLVPACQGCNIHRRDAERRLAMGR